MCTSKKPLPGAGRGFAINRKSSRPIRRSAAGQSRNSRGGRIIGRCKRGAKKDHGLLRRYITPSRGSFRREPTTVVRVTLERGSAQRAGQLRDRKSVARTSFLGRCHPHLSH